MKSTDLLREDIVADTASMHVEHQVQMARRECYNAAEAAVAVHQLLKNVDDHSELEPWITSKLTLAADYLKEVQEHLSYDEHEGIEHTEEIEIPDFDQEFDSVMGESVINESWDKFDEWKNAVLAAHKDKASAIKFRSEKNGSHVSAEIPGEDRCYGFYDLDTDECHVFDDVNESIMHGDRDETLIDAVSTTKYGKIKWVDIGGTNFIYSINPITKQRVMHMSGDSKTIAAKWKALKNHLRMTDEEDRSHMVKETTSSSVATTIGTKGGKKVGSLFGGSYSQGGPFSKKQTKK